MRIFLFSISFLFCTLAIGQQHFLVPLTEGSYYQSNSILNQSLIPVLKGDQLVITPKIAKTKHKHYLLNGL